ncbi:MAG: hypothetical protein L3J18_15405 [Candidatus Brocadia sp.]|nr:MAG: hypothetical protein L3J18_15405 [Candidatus Brocadia sp.]
MSLPYSRLLHLDSTGAIHTQTTELKRRVEFLAFMDQLLLDLPESDKKEVHVILDNYCIHKRNEGVAGSTS